jgi:hypothetical protein
VVVTAAAAVVVGVVGVALLADDVRPAQSDAVEGFRAHQTGAEGGMSAIVTGIVEVDLDSGCVWLSDRDGARSPVVWPFRTVVQVDPFGIVLGDGQLVQAGDRVEGGGGYVDADAALTGMGLEPFPAVCVQVGEAAVFNADSPITVTPGEGLELAETLVGRFSPPEPIGLELIAINPTTRSVAVIDFVTGTVHHFEPAQYEAPTDAIDGASGGGGFIHLWASGTVHTYWPLDGKPLVYQPDPLREPTGIAPTLEVLPGPDGDHTWLVQPGFDDQPTLIELVNVVEFQLTRLMSTEIEGSWQPMGVTIEGLVLTTDDPGPRTRLVAVDGVVETELPGTALSVGWNGAAILLPDGSLAVTDASLENPTQVEKPGEGEWSSMGGPVVPANSPPARTGTDRYLVMLASDAGQGGLSAGNLIVVDAAGVATTIFELSQGSHLASWSRAGDWVVVVEGSTVTLVSVDDGSTAPLGDLIPNEHWVLTAG